MLCLLSPSKTLDFSAYNTAGIATTSPDLLKESEKLIAELKKLSAEDIGALMHISDKLAALNHERFQSFTTPFTPKNAKPALLAFKGDVYDGLDAASLSPEALAASESHIRILSGLYGLLRPFDLIQPYRLEMGTKLANPRGKDLYAFWGETVTKTLNTQLKTAGADTIINLASLEYASAVQPKAVKARWINVHFKEEKGNKLQIIGLFAKRARGTFARFLLQNNITTPTDLPHFNTNGYRYRDDLSTDTDLIFSRPSPTK